MASLKQSAHGNCKFIRNRKRDFERIEKAQHKAKLHDRFSQEVGHIQHMSARSFTKPYASAVSANGTKNLQFFNSKRFWEARQNCNVISCSVCVSTGPWLSTSVVQFAGCDLPLKFTAGLACGERAASRGSRSAGSKTHGAGCKKRFLDARLIRPAPAMGFPA